MKLDTIEKVMQHAAERQMSPEKFGRLAAENLALTCVDITKGMDRYRKECAVTFIPGSRKLPAPKAKATPTVSADAGDSLTKKKIAVDMESTSAPIRLSIINRSAAKDFALKVSKERRAGKFNRVSKDFLDSVEADLEASIRDLGREHADDTKPNAEADWFINGRAVRSVEERLNLLARAIIHSKVMKHPTLGKTLK